MTNVIVLFPKIEDAKNIRNLLVRHGFRVSAVCTTGAQALASAMAWAMASWSAATSIRT